MVSMTIDAIEMGKMAFQKMDSRKKLLEMAISGEQLKCLPFLDFFFIVDFFVSCVVYSFCLFIS
jgi:hypothetical protein